MHYPKFLAFVLAIVFASCSNPKNESSQKVADKVTEVAQLQFKKDAVKAIFVSYEALRDAFVATDLKATKTVLVQLREAFQKEEGTESLVSIVDQMAEANDIASQRVHFFSLNKEMEKLISGELKVGEIYKAYCPMAFDNTGGFWLTSKKEVLNPYFGDKMLKCGYIQDSIQ